MSFFEGLIKTAFTSPHTQLVKMRATPKSEGGKNGRKKYTLKYHPEEKRWSCDCPDWRYRRMKSGENCKHVKKQLLAK